MQEKAQCLPSGPPGALSWDSPMLHQPHGTRAWSMRVQAAGRFEFGGLLLYSRDQEAMRSSWLLEVTVSLSAISHHLGRDWCFL